MARQVKIRFLGEKFQKGVPKKKFVDIGRERFWNYPRFKEQDADAAYTRPVEFFEKHKDILSDTRRFIVTFISGKVEIDLTKKPAVETKAPLLTPGLAEKDVIELAGLLYCPHCDFMTDATKKMMTHLVTHA